MDSTTCLPTTTRYIASDVSVVPERGDLRSHRVGCHPRRFDAQALQSGGGCSTSPTRSKRHGSRIGRRGGNSNATPPKGLNRSLFADPKALRRYGLPLDRIAQDLPRLLHGTGRCLSLGRGTAASSLHRVCESWCSPCSPFRLTFKPSYVTSANKSTFTGYICTYRWFFIFKEQSQTRAPLPRAPLPSAPLPSAPLPSAPLPSAPLPSAPLPSAPLPSAPLPSPARSRARWRGRMRPDAAVGTRPFPQGGGGATR